MTIALHALNVGTHMGQLSRMKRMKNACEDQKTTTSRISAGCKCRFSEQTFFHSGADLERIMSVRCPLHIFRDLGNLSWAPLSMPLRAEDRPLCTCSPSPTREWLEGKRGPLTEEEQTQECLSWEQALSEDPEDKMKVDALVNNYYKTKRRRNEIVQW